MTIPHAILRGFALALAAIGLHHSSTSAQKSDDLRLRNLPVGKVLFLGNSITLHGPAPAIGWTGNWGMAASAEDKDYVHLLLDMIAKQAGGRPKAMVKNVADFERTLTDFKVNDALKQELAFEPDVVIIALGENAAPLKTSEDKAKFRKAFSGLLSALKERGKPTIFVRGQFWADADKDAIMKETCNEAGGVFVDNSKLGSLETNFARSERKIDHAGVAGHPGDRGMQAIADAIWHAMKEKAGIGK